MKTKTAKTLQNLRIFSQWVFTLLFLCLFLLPFLSSSAKGPATQYFFYSDPLLFINGLILTKTISILFLLSIIPLVLTLFLGKFFCGWICPMGAMQQMVSWIAGSSKAWKEGPDKHLLRFKYLVLAFIIVTAILGSSFATWADPFSLLTRSLAAFLPKNPEGRLAVLPLLPAAIFILILMMNIYRSRFFCNVICPLGALYGLVSRFGIFRIRTGTACNECHSCSSHCPYGGDAGKYFMKSECISCFNCAADCPSETVEISIGKKGKKPSANIDPGRRSFFGTVALGVAAAYLPKISYSSGKGLKVSFLRPPGSLKEKSFLDRCQRCGQCIQACPTGFIRPAVSEAGIAGVWTPVVNAKYGDCEFTCNACTQVCPSGAIQKISLEKKQVFKIGTAIVDKDICYTHADGFNCSVCRDACPLPQKAILFRETETWNYQGRKVRVKQIYVDPDICTGCGICENVCVRPDEPGIFITAGDEYRSLIN